jgi:hypothetical protein
MSHSIKSCMHELHTVHGVTEHELCYLYIGLFSEHLQPRLVIITASRVKRTFVCNIDEGLLDISFKDKF